MQTKLADPVTYGLPLGEQSVALNPHLGKALKLLHTGNIFCIHCGRKTSKSFNQGYCYPCFASLAQCDLCIVKPEQCHYDLGTCREPEWAQGHCFQPHAVYLANSSGIKVGITRISQIPVRWIDQGAVQALPVLQVASRNIAGLAEVAIAKHVGDKTNWRRMLKQTAESVDLPSMRDELLARCAETLESLRQRFGREAVEVSTERNTLQIRYPLIAHPQKIVSLGFDKQREVAGVLQGIKGQYLLLDTGVINIRKFSGYEVELIL
jgi:hypothetical protein